MAADWQQFVIVNGRRYEPVMVIPETSRYLSSRPPVVVLQRRDGLFFQLAPEPRIPTVWDMDERGFWVPQQRGHSRTRDIAERHAQSGSSEEPRRAKGIFGRQKARKSRRGSVFFPGA